MFAPETPSPNSVSFFAVTPKASAASSPAALASPAMEACRAPVSNFSKLGASMKSLKRNQARALVVDWLLEVAREFKVHPPTDHFESTCS